MAEKTIKWIKMSKNFPMTTGKKGKGLQKVMEKYTYLVAERLIGRKDFVVRFTDKLYASGFHLRGLNRFSENPSAVYYQSDLYEPNELAPHAFGTIVHEITHCQDIGLDDNLNHTNDFNDLFKKNMSKVDDLRKKFNKEVGWEEDFVYEEDDD